MAYDVAQHDQRLKRDLKNRHIQMIALGGAIGTGLFYGSADSISLAGPAILIAYLIGGLIIFWVVRALGEMSVHEPVAGAFTHYAHKYWSRRAGFVSGWNYWFNYIAVAMVELAVVGSFVNYWLPEVPPWVSAAFFLVLITFINLVGVKTFGEFEFWFAVVKVVAVIAMIVLGTVVVILGVNSNPELPDPSFSHLWDHGGFMPMGLTGIIAAMAVVMFSFGGTELVAVAAGEADRPQQSIPRAINQVILRILLFYILALAVIMSVVPWHQIDGHSSPFVQIFDAVGITGAAHILNLVMLTAVISVYNSGLFSNARMLYSLALQGNAPSFLTKVSGRGVPYWGVLVSSAVTVIAVVVVMLWPDFAFRYLMSVALAAALINWTMVMITHRKFRAQLSQEEREKLHFKLPVASVVFWIVLVFFALLVVIMGWSQQYRTAVFVGPLWLVLLLVAYEIKTRRRSQRPGQPQQHSQPASRHVR
ncbi:amino acid permease [Auritidibacter sp. NML120636]|uniref:amino acid permease n=1 Tax=Auritidibacter sp. NML120636 TaxID=2170743 RepID=UPI001F27166F|nr:amino acid permease [Auritidibacter sp. NML120636]